MSKSFYSNCPLMYHCEVLYMLQIAQCSVDLRHWEHHYIAWPLIGFHMKGGSLHHIQIPPKPHLPSDLIAFA